MPQDRIKMFDEFMAYLEELDKIFNSFGRSLKSYKEKIKTKRGILTETEINKAKKDLANRLNIIKECARAFDSFQEFYKQIVEELKKFDMVWFVDPKFTDPKNRTTINKDEVNKKIKEAKETLIDLIREKISKFKALEQELSVKGKQISTYLAKLGVTKDSISPKQIEVIRVYSTLEETIKPLNISVDEFLKRFNKSISDLTPEELQMINNNVKDYFKEIERQPLQNIETIDLLEEERMRRVA